MFQTLPDADRELNMKTVAMVGGIGPESTVEYYRLIIASHQEQARDVITDEVRGLTSY